MQGTEVQDAGKTFEVVSNLLHAMRGLGAQFPRIFVVLWAFAERSGHTGL